jgi:hypothetical protein
MYWNTFFTIVKSKVLAEPASVPNGGPVQYPVVTHLSSDDDINVQLPTL